MKSVRHPNQRGHTLLSRRSLLVGLGASGLAGCTGPEPAVERTFHRPFGEMVGLNVKFVQGQPLSELKTLNELKVRWVRENIWWGDIEPEPERFVDFPPLVQQQLAFYRQHDIGFVALLSISNGRAYPATPTDPRRPFDAKAFARFAVTVARMLKAQGVRFVLELGNEPHNDGMPKAFGGSWQGKAPSPWVDQYAAMVREAVRQLQGFDASIKTLSDDDMWIVHYWFLEAGLPAELTGFAVHPYTDVPEITAVAHDTDWTRPFQVVDLDRSFGSAVRRLREAGRAKRGNSPEIWVTEWGWLVASPPVPKSVSEEVLAAYLPRAFILAANAGVQAMCWFSAQDTVDGAMGLSDNSLRRRLPYHAFKNMTEQLGRYTLVRQIVGESRPTTGLQAFLFRGATDMKMVAWRVDTTARAVALPLTGAVDVMGRKVETRPSAQSTSVSVGTAPVYLSGNWTDETLNAFAATSR